MSDEFKIDVKGLKEVSKSLEKIGKKMKALDGREVSFNDLFPPAFMERHTQFKSIDEMVEKSPFTVESQEDFEKIPDNKWDEFIRNTTSFQSWEEMMSKAGEEFFSKALK